MARSSGSGRNRSGGGPRSTGLLSRAVESPWLRRGIAITVVLLVLLYAVEGGEYGTSDLVVQRGERQQLEAAVQELRDSVEALKSEIKAVATDPAVLERIAREEYGMVKGDKEILYR